MKTDGEITRLLKDKSDNEQRKELREQIEMRTRGLQWVEFNKKWSSKQDDDVGTVPELTSHLKDILVTEGERRAANALPLHAPAPIAKRKTYKELGTPTAQAIELAGQRLKLSDAELRVAAERERARLEASGEIDHVGDRQPTHAPSFESLVGKMLEVRWRYYTVENGQRKQVYIWCSGEVVEVADGKSTKKSARCKSPLPWGAVRIRWPADVDYDEPESFTWTVLKPCDWNKDVHLGWRFDASELELS